MAIDPVIREQMKQIVMRSKMLEKEIAQLQKDIPMWRGRVELATKKGMAELAGQASAKADELQEKLSKARLDLEVLGQEKEMLRYQSKRPSGVEVARAEAMLEQVRLGGLVDPDKAQMERELDELVTFDFSDDAEDSKG